MKLRAADVEFISPYQVDLTGRVFRLNGEVYRAIGDQHCEFYRTLLGGRMAEQLFRVGLVETKLTDFELDGYSLVVRHHTVAFPSYVMEWNMDMLRDAALMMCDLWEKVVHLDLVMTDAHPWNVLFDGCRPVLVDLGAISPSSAYRTELYLGFRAFFIFPLLLMSAGCGPIARALMDEVSLQWNRGDVMRLTLGRVPVRESLTFRSWDSWLLQHQKAPDSRFFSVLKGVIQRIRPQCGATEWTQYEGIGDRHGAEVLDAWPAKLSTVRGVLADISPKTVVDLGCNKGWFSELACKMGAKVAAVDIDERSLCQLYSRSKRDNLSILPVLMDILQPTAAHGYGRVYRAAEERLSADLVISLATIHHLCLGKSMRLISVLGLLAAYAKRHLLVEFIPPEDEHVRKMTRTDTGWYTWDAFLSAASSIFRSVRVFDSSPKPRKLVLCSR